MKKILIVLVLILVLVFGYIKLIKKPSPSILSTTNTAISKTNIQIKDFAFNPSVINIQKGETITWMNNDTVPHQIAFNDVKSEVLNNNQSFSYTFNDSGSFDYHCAIHPHMMGQVIVK